MTHHKNQWQITNRIKHLLSAMNEAVQGTANDAEASRGDAGHQYYRGKAHGVEMAAGLVLEHLGPICEDPDHVGLHEAEVLGDDRDCPLCEGQSTFKCIETVPQDGKPGSIFGCMQCGHEERVF